MKLLTVCQGSVVFYHIACPFENKWKMERFEISAVSHTVYASKAECKQVLTENFALI